MLQLGCWYNKHTKLTHTHTHTHTHTLVIVVPSRLETLSWNTIGIFAVKQLLNKLYATVCHVVECCRMLASPRWLIYPMKDYPSKISLFLKQLVSISLDLFLLKTMASYLADMFCSSPVLLLEQYILMFQMISQQFLQSTASGVLLAAEENPTDSSPIVASHLLVQTMPCNLASQK